MRHPQQGVEHQPIGQRRACIHQLARQAQPVGDGEGQQHADPIRRVQPREARDHKIHRGAGAVKCHEDDKAADDEEQVDAEVAVRYLQRCLRCRWVQRGKLAGVVEQHHRERGHATQCIHFG